MLKQITFLLSASLLCLGLAGGVQAEQVPSTTNSTASVKSEEQIKNSTEEALRELGQSAERITVKELQARIDKHSSDDELYIKVNEEDAFVFTDIIENTSLQRQIIYLLPAGQIQHYYTNNKKTADSMYKMLKRFQKNITDVNGYRVVTDMDKVAKEATAPTYHLWSIKLRYTPVVSYGRDWGYPFDYGFWGWGPWYPYYGHHVYRHHGGSHGGHRGHHK